MNNKAVEVVWGEEHPEKMCQIYGNSSERELAMREIASQKERALHAYELQQYRIDEEMKQKLAYMNTCLDPIILEVEDLERWRMIKDVARYERAMSVVK